MELHDTYQDEMLVLCEILFMDNHADDWFISEDDMDALKNFEYDCWCDDCIQDYKECLES